MNNSPECQISVIWFLHTIYKFRRVGLLVGVILSAFLVLGNPFIFTNTFTSSALLEISSNDFNDGYEDASQSFKANLTSDAVLRPVAREFLDNGAEVKHDDIVTTLFTKLGYKVDKKVTTEDDIISIIRDKLRISQVSDSNSKNIVTYKLEYETNTSPENSMKVVNGVIVNYMHQNTTVKKKKYVDTIKYLYTNVKKIKVKLSTLKQNYSDFKLENSAKLMSLESIVNDTDEVKNKITETKLELSANRAKLASAKLFLDLQPKYDVQIINDVTQLSGADVIAVKEQELTTALMRYTRKHPDVKILLRELRVLRASSNIISGSTSSPVGKTINPSFITLSTQVSDIKTQISTAEVKLKNYENRLVALQENISPSISLMRKDQEFKELIEEQRALFLTEIERLRSTKRSLETIDTTFGSNFRIVDAAKEGVFKYASRTKPHLIGVVIGSGLGVMTSVALAALLIMYLIHNYYRFINKADDIIVDIVTTDKDSNSVYGDTNPMITNESIIDKDIASYDINNVPSVDVVIASEPKFQKLLISNNIYNIIILIGYVIVFSYIGINGILDNYIIQ